MLVTPTAQNTSEARTGTCFISSSHTRWLRHRRFLQLFQHNKPRAAARLFHSVNNSRTRSLFTLPERRTTSPAGEKQGSQRSQQSDRRGWKASLGRCLSTADWKTEHEHISIIFSVKRTLVVLHQRELQPQFSIPKVKNSFKWCVIDSLF